MIPNVQTAWETFVVTKCSEATNNALKAYDVMMTSRLAGQLPCDNEEIRNSHEAALEQGIAQLEAETMGISAVTTEKYLKELRVSQLVESDTKIFCTSPNNMCNV